MAHDIKPLADHSVLNIQLAIHSTDPDEIADGLNEFFRPEIGEGWIADYALFHTDKPTVVTSSTKPEEGELFDKASLYTICVQDSDYNEEWIKIETELDLAAMDESKLRKVLSGKVVIGQEDRVFVGAVKGMQRITLTANDELFPYCVSVYEDKGDKHALDFYCMADDECHAEEQALNAYPNGEIRHINEVAPENYPYEIN